MNYGKFFKLNNTKSNLSRGIAIFDYIWLKDDKVKDGSPEFPVYLSISLESLDFYVHYHYDSRDISSDKHSHKHLHNTILLLPISANLDVKDGLTGALVDGWNTNFPTYEQDTSNYLYECFTEVIIAKKDDDFSKTNRTYSTLEVFKCIENLDRNPPINWFIRKLILDFLFDLEHTKVFQNSPYYEHISIKLRENFFFNALANKAMYYYYRKMTEEEMTKEKMTEEEMTEEENRKRFFLKEYFLPAEEQWIKSIINPRSDLFFTLKEDCWFKNPEKELADIYDDTLNGIMLYDEIQENSDDIKTKLEKITTDVSKWQLQKYDLKNVLPQWMFEIGGIFAVLSLISIFLPLPIKLSINICSFICIVLLLLCFGIIYTASYCYRYRIKQHKKLKLRYSRKINLFLPRLLGAIIAGWLMIAFASNIFPQFYAICFNDIELLLKNSSVCAILLVLTFVFVYYNGVDKETPYLNKRKPFLCLRLQKDKLLRTSCLMFIAFCYSYIIGIFATALIGTKAITPKEYKYSVYIDFWGSDVYISPGFLFVFTFVAMFIGLFINLIFEDKRITDSV